MNMFTVENADILPSWVKQTASFDKENILKLKYGMPSHGVPAIPQIEEFIRTVRIKTVNFETVLGMIPRDSSLELLQIDAEGFDWEVIKLFPFRRAKPSIVRYEHMHLSAEARRAAASLLRGQGYTLLAEKSDTTAVIPSRIGC
jgi:hypothetical protein